MKVYRFFQIAATTQIHSRRFQHVSIQTLWRNYCCWCGFCKWCYFRKLVFEKKLITRESTSHTTTSFFHKFRKFFSLPAMRPPATNHRKEFCRHGAAILMTTRRRRFLHLQRQNCSKLQSVSPDVATIPFCTRISPSKLFYFFHLLYLNYLQPVSTRFVDIDGKTRFHMFTIFGWEL